MEERKELFYLTMHSTHFICSYMMLDRHMVKDYSDSERGHIYIYIYIYIYMHLS